MGLRLHPEVEVTVLGSARSARERLEDFGCGLHGPASRRVRRACEPLTARIRELGREAALARARELVRSLERTPRYAAMCDGRTIGGRRRLREDVLFPRTGGGPRLLHFRRGARAVDVEVRDWAAAGDELAALGRGEGSPGGPLARGLARLGFLARAVRAPRFGEGVLWIGHNSAVVATSRTRLLVDPWLRPASPVDRGYRPLGAPDAGPVDAIAITHSHGDHFHLGSLLAFGRHTPVYVPAIARESLFSTDLAARLAQAGFTSVHRVPWWESRTIGDLELRALPFHGEQPTGGKGLYRGLWNEGNTWVVRGPAVSAAFFADSGRDARGDMLEVCRRERRAHGAVDLLFTGIRGFSLEPLFYGFTTLDAYLVNVRPEELDRKQRLMADPADALDFGHALGASRVVPYADGGAPWYWREGMGAFHPGYRGEGVKPATPGDDPDSDPFPERLVAERAKRSRGPRALVLRPGDLVRGASVHRFEPFAWPHGELPLGAASPRK
jgi:L-ascorbate metabolism protein UlaG (beta-lactamase superfamily)